jgi:threonine/homoserine/homoserine lactone efflux protein
MGGLSDPLLFLGLVAFISLSGALMPGPVFATAVAKGCRDRNAGAKIAAGHAVIEIPLVAAIFLGFETVLRNDAVFAAIGLVGGVFLFYMGASMMRTRMEDDRAQGSKLGPFAAGVALTAANPYFLLWWATVGASLIGTATGYGLVILPLFVMVHLACDLGWLQFVSFSVNRSRRLLTGRGYRYLFVACGAFLMVFALYFVVSSVQTLM